MSGSTSWNQPTGQRFGVGYLVDILAGKSDPRISRNAHDKLNVYGAGKDLKPDFWRGLFRQLMASGHIAADTDGHGSLALTERARPLLRGEEQFLMREVAVPAKSTREKKATQDVATGAASLSNSGHDLYASLKTLRHKLATEASLPPYVICHDRTLVELAKIRPRTATALHDITGLGERKIARYGAALLDVIRSFAPSAEAPQEKISPNNRLSTTATRTLELQQLGKTAEEIAKERGFEISTIYGHFAEIVETGIEEANSLLSLAPDELHEISAAFERCQTIETGKLGPAHAALGGKYDYGILKCLLAELV